MHPTLTEAFRRPSPGRLVRWTRFLPGMATTAEQIERFADYWRCLGIEAVASNRLALVALGDSLAQGIGASGPEAGYVGRLRGDLMVDGEMPPVLNLSRSGATIADVIATQLPALAASGVTARLVVCTVGSNDLMRSARLLRTRRELRRLIELLPPDAMLATVPARGSLVAKRLNRHLRAMAEERGLAVADVDAGLDTWRGNQAADRFHPNDSGYRIWVDAFRARLTERSGSEPTKGR